MKYPGRGRSSNYWGESLIQNHNLRIWYRVSTQWAVTRFDHVYCGGDYI